MVGARLGKTLPSPFGSLDKLNLPFRAAACLAGAARCVHIARSQQVGFPADYPCTISAFICMSSPWPLSRSLANSFRLNSFRFLWVISCACRLIIRPLSRYTPRYLIACPILILLPLILIIGGLSASNLPLTSSICVFFADNANFFLVHQAETRVTTSYPFSCSSFLALPATRIIMSAYAIGSYSVALAVSWVNRFQKLGPSTDPCGHPFVAGLLTVLFFPNDLHSSVQEVAPCQPV